MPGSDQKSTFKIHRIRTISKDVLVVSSLLVKEALGTSRKGLIQRLGCHAFGRRWGRKWWEVHAGSANRVKVCLCEWEHCIGDLKEQKKEGQTSTEWPASDLGFCCLETITDDAGAIFCSFLWCLWVPPETGTQDLFLLISQYPATVPTDRTKQEDHRQGSLEYAVGRLSVQVPLWSLPMWRLRPISYCIQQSWSMNSGSVHSLHPWLLFGCVWWSEFSPCWWAPQMSVSSEFCLFTTYFSFGFSGTPLIADCVANPWGGFGFSFSLISPWPLIPRCV